MRKVYGGVFSISQQQFAICRENWISEHTIKDDENANIATAQEIILRRCNFRPEFEDLRLWDDWKTDSKWFRVKSFNQLARQYLFETPEGAEFPRLRETTSTSRRNLLPTEYTGKEYQYPEVVHRNAHGQVKWVDTTITIEPVIYLDEDGEPRTEVDTRIVDNEDETRER